MQILTKPLLLSLLIIYVLAMAGCGGPSIELGKDWIMPGRTMKVKWSAPAKLQKKDAWIGVVLASTPADEVIDHDENPDLFFKALAGKTSGKFEMTVPGAQRDYEVRIYSSEENAKVIVSAPFTVSNTLKI